MEQVPLKGIAFNKGTASTKYNGFHLKNDFQLKEWFPLK